MGERPQGSAECFGLAMGAQLSRLYPVHTAKNVAADLNCTHKHAENILAGHLSAKSITRLTQVYGLGLLIDAGAALTGTSLRDFIIAQAEQARLEQARAKDRERELLALEQGLAAVRVERASVRRSRSF